MKAYALIAVGAALFALAVLVIVNLFKLLGGVVGKINKDEEMID